MYEMPSAFRQKCYQEPNGNCRLLATAPDGPADFRHFYWMDEYGEWSCLGSMCYVMDDEDGNDLYEFEVGKDEEVYGDALENWMGYLCADPIDAEDRCTDKLNDALIQVAHPAGLLLLKGHNWIHVIRKGELSISETVGEDVLQTILASDAY